MARRTNDEDEEEDVEPRRRSKKKAVKEKRSFLDQLSRELKKSVIAIALLGVSIILVLALFDKAGPAGHYAYIGLVKAFGWGYYLLPATTLVLAIVFLAHHELEWLAPPLFGGLGFIIAALGAIDIIFPHNAGFVGTGVGMIQKPFGYQSSLVIMGVVMLTSFIIALDLPLHIKRKEKKEEKKKSVTENGTDVNAAVASAEEAAKTAATEEKKKDKGADIVIGKEAELPVMNKKPVVFKDYVPPPLSLLISSIERPTAGDLRANANIIKRTMDSFGISVEMGEINIGPKFTRYTLKPAEGVRLAKLTALGQDLALALAAHPIRIEAPIPGKSLVGIEVPNKTAAMVRLGSLLAYPEFSQSHPLSVILGRDVTGEPISVNIAKMPHVLVAGATGSGKSVTIHTFITSLLFKNSPQTLQFIMIDPKKVELSIYNGIPHLASPVVTEGKKAAGVFRWAIQEMERRYETLLKAGCRDITGYNAKNKDTQMPFLVIVVDELADLMVAYGKDIETAIVRLAQMARATGIHLMVATQRPSVEVITGLIKANIPCRIALQVASQIDSRTILDSAGAEKLLGGGDMLVLSSEFSKPKRLQGAFVTEAEIHSVVDFIKEHNQPKTTDTPIVLDLNGNPVPTTADLIAKPAGIPDLSFEDLDSDEDDELYDEAVETVKQAQKASASLLQRRLKVGYARAARLLDLMEAKGIIGAGDGAKPREVFLEKSVDEISASDFQ
ncbi:MAG: DNA translocase FtsK [Candidatus Pacebacteria bacterium]|nr:DNA translocase FtsK [Candidatus Paceibacterota bacterium]